MASYGLKYGQGLITFWPFHNSPTVSTDALGGPSSHEKMEACAAIQPQRRKGHGGSSAVSQSRTGHCRVSGYSGSSVSGASAKRGAHYHNRGLFAKSGGGAQRRCLS